MQFDNQDRLLVAILLSVFAHAGSFLSLTKIASLTPEPVERSLLVVDLIEPTKSNALPSSDSKQTIVRQVDLPEDALSLEARSERRFLSEKDQNVKQEMRAALTGMTRNRQGRAPIEDDSTQSTPKNSPTQPQQASPSPQQSRSGAQPASANPQNEESAQSSSPPSVADTFNRFSDELPDYGDIDVGQRKDVPKSILKEQKNKKSPTAKDSNRSDSENVRDKATANFSQREKELIFPNDPRNPGMSTVGELLPEDLKIGNFTALNTDRFIYYTFYARVEEAIRHRWVRYVKAAIYSGQVPPSNDSFRTRLEIVLDPKGQFINGFIHDSSGSQSLDQAPLYAFREAERIPNPPREMVQSDGTIRLHYFFQVDKTPQRPVQGQDRSRVGP